MTNTDTLNSLQGHARPDVPVSGVPTTLWLADVTVVNPDGTVDVMAVQSRATKVGVRVPSWYPPAVGDRVLVTNLGGDPRQPVVVVPFIATVAVNYAATAGSDGD